MAAQSGEPLKSLNQDIGPTMSLSVFWTCELNNKINLFAMQIFANPFQIRLIGLIQGQIKRNPKINNFNPPPRPFELSRGLACGGTRLILWWRVTYKPHAWIQAIGPNDLQRITNFQQLQSIFYNTIQYNTIQSTLLSV